MTAALLRGHINTRRTRLAGHESGDESGISCPFRATPVPDTDAGGGAGDDTTADAYATIAGQATSHFTVQGSEFIGHAAPVETIESAESFVDLIRDEYADATHNVPAYRVRADPFREYASDDGEPSGSAGKPMLSVLAGRDLENVCVVVTRYFGGTELGVGGLVRAYSKATKDALNAAETIRRRPQMRFRAIVGYDDSGTVRGILESEDATFEADYGARVSFDVSVPVAAAEGLLDRLRSATSDRIDVDDR
ncbi:MAG: putative YigZ family protein [Natronomonas sp.]